MVVINNGEKIVEGNVQELMQNELLKVSFKSQNLESIGSFLKNQSIVSSGGVIEAIPWNWSNSISALNDSLYFEDSVVYYWRSRPDSSVVDWKVRSFQYIPKKWGWGQCQVSVHVAPRKAGHWQRE